MNPRDFYEDLQMLSMESEVNAAINEVQHSKIENATKEQKRLKR